MQHLCKQNLTDKAGVKLFKQSSVLGAAGVIRRNLSHIISNDYCSIKMFLMEVFSLSENQDYSLQNILYEGVYQHEGQCWWWLRSLGYNSGSATLVSTGGSVRFYGDGVYYNYVSVRPALWINLKS